MKYTITFIISFLFLFLFAGVSHGLSIQTFGASFPATNSWDNPQSSISSFLETKYSGDTITLNLVNGVGGATGTMETWFGEGIKSIILEENAGFSENTTFGWYDNSTSVQLFSGANSSPDESGYNFSPAQSFGFYIDPNGVTDDRMYTEHKKNADYAYQVAIFQINNSNNYILGWEDLSLGTSGTGGDRDYQDMIVSVSIAPVPEPATMLLFGTGLLGLAGLRLRKKK